MPPFTFNYENQFMPCECCKLKYTTTTSTATNGFKWSKKEIEREILHFAQELANAKWYERENLRRKLKHWTDKLARLKKYEQEFKNYGFRHKGIK
jgi:hypothetical protein